MSNLFKKLFRKRVSKANKRYDQTLKEINLKTVKTHNISPNTEIKLTATVTKKKPVTSVTAKKVADSNKAKTTTKKTTPKKK